MSQQQEPTTVSVDEVPVNPSNTLSGEVEPEDIPEEIRSITRALASQEPPTNPLVALKAVRWWYAHGKGVSDPVFRWALDWTLHLVSDSCTKSGIRWIYPFRRWTVRGSLKTTPKLRDTIYQQGFLLVLGGGVGLLFFLPSIYSQISAIMFTLVGLVYGIVLWAVFAKFVAKCEVQSVY